MYMDKKREILSFRPFLSALFLICAFFLLTSCEGSKKIVYGLEQNEANEILVFLSSKGIDADKTKSLDAGGGGSKVVLWDITVKSSDSNEAMRQLNQQGLPRRPTQSVLGIFATSGLVSSDLQEKIKYRAALAAQLAGTIRKYEGVLDADVQVSFPEEDPLNPGKTKGKITASIWVKHSGVLDDPNRHLKSKIKSYVASAITGLNYDDVNIVGERSKVGDSPSEGMSAREEDKKYVNVWSMTVDKDSVTRFRIIFFTFILLILLIALALIWLVWKIFPVLKKHGGIKALLSVKPLESSGKASDELAKGETDKTASPTKEDGKKTKSIDKNVDET